ncbi:hypothetical protein EV426DRAFT_709937 [Tirmania nivea]|nr:hypothetical protein EV426DRAFT_709937 [Tirmania nivea]
MSQVHPSRHSLVPQAKPSAHRHKRSPPTTVAEAEAAAPTSVSHLRRKIRDLTRLLSRANTATTTPKDGSSTLPPAAIIQTERALASYKRDLALLQQSTKERKLNERYRMTQRAKEEILNDIKQRMEEGTLGKWTVNVETADDEDLHVEEGRVQLGRHGTEDDDEEEEEEEEARQRKSDQEAGKEHKGKSDKSRSKSKKKHKIEHQEEQQPAAAETDGFFEF